MWAYTQENTKGKQATLWQTPDGRSNKDPKQPLQMSLETRGNYTYKSEGSLLSMSVQREDANKEIEIILIKNQIEI